MARPSVENTQPDAGLPELERLRRSLRALQRDNSGLRLLVSIHDRLGNLVLQGASIAAITAVLADLLHRPVLILDPLLRRELVELPNAATAGVTLTPSPVWSPNEAYAARVLQTMTGQHQALRLPPLPDWGVAYGVVMAPIVVGDAILGYLAIPEAEPGGAEGVEAPDVDLPAAQHAASVYALALMRERVTAEVTTQLRDELIEGLLLGHVQGEQAASTRARRLGYDETVAHRLLVLQPETGAGAAGEADDIWATARRRRLLNSLAEVVRERAPDAIVSVRDDELVTLLPASAEPGVVEVGRAASHYISARYPDRPLTGGIGGPCQPAVDIARAYRQARRAIDVAMRYGRRGEVVAFEDLGLYRLLFNIGNPTELRAFVEQALGPLLAYDRQHHTDLVATMGCYLSNNCSLKVTAGALSLHVNTVAYRIQRIQSLSGLDLSQADDCLIGRVAQMILDDSVLP